MPGSQRASSRERVICRLQSLLLLLHEGIRTRPLLSEKMRWIVGERACCQSCEPEHLPDCRSLSMRRRGRSPVRLVARPLRVDVSTLKNWNKSRPGTASARLAPNDRHFLCARLHLVPPPTEIPTWLSWPSSAWPSHPSRAALPMAREFQGCEVGMLVECDWARPSVPCWSSMKISPDALFLDTACGCARTSP